VVIILVVAGVLLTVDFGNERVEIPAPAHSYLTQAASHLAQTYQDDQYLARATKNAQRNLSDTLDLLDKARQVDAADRGEIRRLRGRLQALEDPGTLSGESLASLRRSYQGLTVEVNTLLHRLERPLP
jgi:hypothetical protein